jgi:aminoglycoside phosphotransferase
MKVIGVDDMGTMTTSTELLGRFPEINLENYDVVDVERLNGWALEAFSALEANASQEQLLLPALRELIELDFGACSYYTQDDHRRLNRAAQTVREFVASKPKV